MWTGERRLGDADPRVRLPLRRSPAPEVRGTVRDAGGAGTARALVELIHPDLNNYTVSTTTDAGGRFALAPVRYGKLLLRTSAAAAAPRVDPIALEDEAHPRLIRDVQLRPACTLHGTVVGPGGAPVGGALVVARPIANRPVRVAAMADGSGRFSLEPLPAGRASVYAEHEQLGVVERAVEIGPHCSAEPLALTLERRRTITARVAFDDGSIGSGVHVHALRADEQASYTPCCSGVTGKDGSLTLEVGKEGRYVVVASRKAGLSFVPGLIHRWQRNVELRGPGDRAAVDLRLPPARSVLSGTVASAEGAPIPGVEVTLFKEILGHLNTVGPPATSDRAGRFAVEDLQEGSYTLVASHRDYPDRFIPELLVRERQTEVPSDHDARNPRARDGRARVGEGPGGLGDPAGRRDGEPCADGVAPPAGAPGGRSRAAAASRSPRSDRGDISSVSTPTAPGLRRGSSQSRKATGARRCGYGATRASAGSPAG